MFSSCFLQGKSAGHIPPQARLGHSQLGLARERLLRAGTGTAWPSTQLGTQWAPAPGTTAMLQWGSHRRSARHSPPLNHSSRPGSRRNSAPGVIPSLQPDSPRTCLQAHPEPPPSSCHSGTPRTHSAGDQSDLGFLLRQRQEGEKHALAAGGNTVRVSPQPGGVKLRPLLPGPLGWLRSPAHPHSSSLPIGRAEKQRGVERSRLGHTTSSSKAVLNPPFGCGGRTEGAMRISAMYWPGGKGQRKRHFSLRFCSPKIF